jgi:acetyl-CoA carboxylase biotin carboxyl carrier protein
MTAKIARARRRDDGKIEVYSPEVGLWREGPALGALVRPGASLGRIEVLGRLVPVVAPDDALGIVVGEPSDGLVRRPVAWGERLVLLDPEGTAHAIAGIAAAAPGKGVGPIFAAPTGGRFYRRPAPDKPAFVEVGDVIDKGHTVAIVEVMKTFSRIHYEGAALPDRARVTRIVPADGDDLSPGDPMLELEPA